MCIHDVMNCHTRIYRAFWGKEKCPQVNRGTVNRGTVNRGMTVIHMWLQTITRYTQSVQVSKDSIIMSIHVSGQTGLTSRRQFIDRHMVNK